MKATIMLAVVLIFSILMGMAVERITTNLILQFLVLSGSAILLGVILTFWLLYPLIKKGRRG